MTNTYTKLTASLTLKKNVNKPDGAPDPSGAYKIAVKVNDESGKYVQDTLGNLGTEIKYFDVTSGAEVVIKNLEVGKTYSLEEDTASTDNITGYHWDGMTGDTSVLLSADKTAVVTNTYTLITTAKYPVEISKQAVGGGPELKDATLKAESTDSGSNYSVSWVSDGVNAKTLQLEAGNYKLTETQAPDDYEIAESIEFEVTADGKVKRGGAEVDANKIIMFDALTPKHSVVFSKQAAGGGNELAGAKLEVKSADGGTYYETWISTGTSKTLELKKGTYTLTEIQEPDGYAKAETITFEVTADGKVKVDGQEVTANTVTMLDLKKVYISKIDAFNSEEIAGAKLKLYKVEDNGDLTEKASWTSSSTEVYTFYAEAGNYAIEEINAPTGYEKVESLVKFNLSYDATGTPKLTVTEGPGKYDEVNDKICFKNDPIKVTGGLTIKVVDEVTGEDVPGAVVEVTEPDSSVKEYTTDENGEVTKYKTGAVLGAYKIRVKSVPDEKYTVTINKEQTVEVVKDKVTEAIAKTNTKTGGLTIVVLDKVTGAAVPNATVEVTEPDGSVKTYTTDSNGRVNKYQETDEQGHYKAALGTYKIRVTKVPDGYSVDTGIVGTETVVVSQVVEHIAKIVTKNDSNDDDDDDDDDDETPANVPTETPVLQEQTVTETTKKSLTGGARRTITESAMSLKTGETNVPDYLFGSSLAALFMGAAAYVMSKRKKEK